jgi:hypothetical protein
MKLVVALVLLVSLVFSSVEVVAGPGQAFNLRDALNLHLQNADVLVSSEATVTETAMARNGRLGPALGLASKSKIPDSSFSASSAHGNSWGYYGPQFGRLNMAQNYGGWL